MTSPVATISPTPAKSSYVDCSTQTTAWTPSDHFDGTAKEGTLSTTRSTSATPGATYKRSHIEMMVPSPDALTELKHYDAQALIDNAVKFLIHSESQAFANEWFRQAYHIINSIYRTEDRERFIASIPDLCVLQHATTFLSSKMFIMRTRYATALQALPEEQQRIHLDEIVPEALILRLPNPFLPESPVITQKFMEVLEGHTGGVMADMIEMLETHQRTSLQAASKYYLNGDGPLHNLAIEILLMPTEKTQERINALDNNTVLRPGNAALFLHNNAPEASNTRWLNAFQSLDEGSRQTYLEALKPEDVLSFHCFLQPEFQVLRLANHWFACRAQRPNTNSHDDAIPESILVEYAPNIFAIGDQSLQYRWLQVFETKSFKTRNDALLSLTDLQVIPMFELLIRSPHQEMKDRWLSAWYALEEENKITALDAVADQAVFDAWKFFLNQNDVLFTERWLAMFTPQARTQPNLALIPDADVVSPKLAKAFIAHGGVLLERFYEAFNRMPYPKDTTSWHTHFLTCHARERHELLNNAPNAFILNDSRFLDNGYGFKKRWDLALEKSPECLTSREVFDDPRSQSEIIKTMGSLQRLRFTLSEIPHIAVPSNADFNTKMAWLHNSLPSVASSYYSRPQITVTRANIVESSMDATRGWDQNTWRRSDLYVAFEGEYGADGGGLWKDWTNLILSNLANPHLGLFTVCGETGQMVCPNAASTVLQDETEAQNMLKFFGRVLGQVIRRKVTTDLDFPNFFMKSMCNLPVGFIDLKDVDPVQYKNMVSILEMDREAIDALSLTFTINVETAGKQCIIELKPHGDQLAVTLENRNEYLQCYAKYRLVTEQEHVLTHIFSGLWDDVPPAWLEVFSVEELRKLFCKTSALDVHAWQEHTQPIPLAATEAQRNMVAWFWEVVESLSHDDQHKLLQLVTGLTNPPPGGFANMYPQFNICFGEGTTREHLPKTATCFNKIVLPPYDSKENLKEKIDKFIEFGETTFQFA